MGAGGDKKPKKDKAGYLVVRAGQAGAELKSVGLAAEGGHPHHHQVYSIYNIYTVSIISTQYL